MVNGFDKGDVLRFKQALILGYLRFIAGMGPAFKQG
jgi:hypothetical protein